MVNKKPEDIKQYYIAYIDILGYRGFFNNSKEEVIDIFYKINNMFNGTIQYLDAFNQSTVMNGDAKIYIKKKIFSDNILICIECLDDKIEIMRLFTFMTAIADIQRYLITNYGFFVRGSIIKGELSFNDDYIFGKGLVDAVFIEEELSIFPRIIIGKELIHYFDNYCIESISKNNFNLEERILDAAKKLLLQCEDGYFCLNYLNIQDKYEIYGREFLNMIIERIKDKYPDDYNYIINEHLPDIDNVLREHRKYIELNLKKTKSEKILQKYRWLMVYHNNICKYYSKHEYCI